MLIATIGERARRLQAPADMLMLRDRATLGEVLTSFGSRFVREVSDPVVVGVSGWRSPRPARRPKWREPSILLGESSRAALRHIMTQARAAGLIVGRPADLAEQFAGLLWRDLLVSLLLGVAERPNPRAIEARARDATEAFLGLSGQGKARARRIRTAAAEAPQT